MRDRVPEQLSANDQQNETRNESSLEKESGLNRSGRIEDDKKSASKSEILSSLREEHTFGRDFSQADLAHLDLRSSVMTAVDLSEANLAGSDLSHSIISRTKFCHANLHDANLRYAYLRNSDFSYADLTDATLIDTDLSGITFEGAKLHGARMHGAKMDGPLRVYAKAQGAIGTEEER